ncbi:S2P endopeptidase [Malassezia cuniculi]|uniref:Endopeptidase S2P n=1 Tax=Malassezia cuniculi TaxID=948313 RepID=A0AAF0ES42_9BASI|nr:S2P endopeptidase [Malassezia cuniculi]
MYGAVQLVTSLCRGGGREYARRDSLLYPLVPGATVPLLHAVPLIGTALAGQLVHEAGHAIAASLEGVSPMRVGASLFFPFVPVAYVVLPQLRRGTFERRRVALRVISAGVWHNVVFLAALFLVAASLGPLFTDANGLLVEHANGLGSWVPAGSTLVVLGDRNISDASAQDRMALWDAFSRGDALEAGRCVPDELWRNATDTCCTSPNDTHACFNDGSAGRCLDPLFVFTQLPPCSGCVGRCVRSSPDERLIHIAVTRDKSVQTVVLRGTLGMAVSTHTLRPAVRALVGYGAVDVTVYYMRLWYWYALVTGVALCIFNMLPLPGLDGSAYVRVVIEGHVIGQQQSSDVPLGDDLEDPAAPQERASDQFAAKMQRVIERVTLGVTVLALVGSIISLL